MLLRAGEKFRRRGLTECCVTLQGDGLRLPFAEASFDAVTVAFGVRNLADLDAGFHEMLRVLRPGGYLVVLEFSRPATPVLASAYRFYLERIMPRIGDRISGRKGPYGYLARTISEFPDAPRLAERIREAGFASCAWRHLSGGIVALHTARSRP
jgi:demethylmenaquinone methyltransferase/2-methoxy-6-polyprenyl-1,4-benzoquinol methylase